MPFAFFLVAKKNKHEIYRIVYCWIGWYIPVYLRLSVPIKPAASLQHGGPLLCNFEEYEPSKWVELFCVISVLIIPRSLVSLFEMMLEKRESWSTFLLSMGFEPNRSVGKWVNVMCKLLFESNIEAMLNIQEAGEEWIWIMI